MPRLGIILQARMGSARLPGKVLRPLAGVAMLDRILRRLKQISLADIVIVATGDNPGNDPLARHVEALGVILFRGSESDVLDRYHAAARRFELDHILRATGDNPFVDSEEGGRLAAFHLAGGYGYSCNFPDQGGGLPMGIGLEIFSMATLDLCWREGRAAHHREHVNDFILENPNLTRSGVPPTPEEKMAPHLKFTVDTPQDFIEAQELISRFSLQTGQDEVTTPWLISTRPAAERPQAAAPWTTSPSRTAP
jgi:spore coat polysaccharide biosynthesis protein SpsF